MKMGPFANAMLDVAESNAYLIVTLCSGCVFKMMNPISLYKYLKIFYALHNDQDLFL